MWHIPVLINSTCEFCDARMREACQVSKRLLNSNVLPLPKRARSTSSHLANTHGECGGFVPSTTQASPSDFPQVNPRDQLCAGSSGDTCFSQPLPNSSPVASHRILRNSDNMYGYDHGKNQGKFNGNTGNDHIPYHGDFSGCAWNAQALFAQDAKKQNSKQSKARQLMGSHDFGCFTETHCVEGRADANKCPQDTVQFWSNKSTSQGGIGLWVKLSFFDKISLLVVGRTCCG